MSSTTSAVRHNLVGDGDVVSVTVLREDFPGDICDRCTQCGRIEVVPWSWGRVNLPGPEAIFRMMTVAWPCCVKGCWRQEGSLSLRVRQLSLGSGVCCHGYVSCRTGPEMGSASTAGHLGPWPGSVGWLQHRGGAHPPGHRNGLGLPCNLHCH